MARKVIYYPTPKWLELSTATTSQLNLRIDTHSGFGWAVDWGDGNTVMYASGQNVTHTYTSPYSGTVRVAPVGGFRDVDEFRINDNNSNWNFDISEIGGLVNLSYLRLYSNSSTWTGDVASLPQNLTYLFLSSNSSTWTGDVASLSQSLTTLFLSSYLSTWTGDIASLSQSLNTLYLNSNSATWTGDVASLSQSLNTLRLYSNSATWTYSTKTWSTLPSTFYLRPAVGYLPTSDINQLAIDTDASGISFGSVVTWDWRGNNASPTGAGLTAIANLATKNINVLHN